MVILHDRIPLITLACFTYARCWCGGLYEPYPSIGDQATAVRGPECCGFRVGGRIGEAQPMKQTFVTTMRTPKH
uniref:Putative secreted protein n=1 Tax=Anopheles darlingi TaxID=43151 RepID=A0A2M4DLE0_ANODA